jgi:hypothetical protein
MCSVCGLNCGKGGALKRHIEAAHSIAYDTYKLLFYGDEKTVVVNSWDDSVNTDDGRTVVTHVLVRRFVRDPGARGVPRSAHHSG